MRVLHSHPWRLLAAGIALGLFHVGTPAAEPVSRPNILFIFADDHSLQAISAYNKWLGGFVRQHNITPSIDRLAAQGALFERSYTGNSLCSPSRATVITGVHTHKNGVTNLGGRIRDGVWTVSGAMRAGGYQTALIGKWHLANEPMGFDYYRVLEGQGAYWQPMFLGPGGLKESIPGYATDIITDRAIDWMKGRDPAKPFFLMCQHKAPHAPWEPPARYYSLLADVEVPEPATLFDDYQGRTSSARRQKMEIGRNTDMTMDWHLRVPPPGVAPEGMSPEQGAEWLKAFGARIEAFHGAKLKGRDLTRWKYQEYMKNYLRCIKAVDDSVGRLLAYLETAGLATNTVVIYSSDQGFFNGEHGWFDKRWIYEESLSMPLIVRWPGVVQPGARVHQLVQNIDYAPTFMEFAGLKSPASVQGRSLVPLLRGETPQDWRTSIYYHYYDPGHNVQKHYGLRNDRFTLAHFYPVNEWELFDNEKDPQQLRNVFDDPAYADRRARLQAELVRLRKLYEDDSDLIPARSETPAAPPKSSPQ